jgi:hypothetical protein
VREAASRDDAPGSAVGRQADTSEAAAPSAALALVPTPEPAADITIF